MTKCLFLILLLVYANCSALSAGISAETNSMLDSLEHHMRIAQTYVRTRQMAIESAKHRMFASSETEDKAAGARDVAHAYTHFNLDSALIYYNMSASYADSAGLTDNAIVTRLEANALLPLAGLCAQAVDAVLHHPATPADSVWAAARQKALTDLYINAMDVTSDSISKKRYAAAASIHLDSLALFFSTESPARKLIEGQASLLKGNKALALGYLNETGSEFNTNLPAEAIVNNLRASYYVDNPSQTDERILHLTKAAIADIKCANRDSEALRRLGKELALEGDYHRASSILSFSISAAGASGSLAHIASDSKSLSMIVDSLRKEAEHDKTVKTILFTVSLILVLACVFLSLRLRKIRSKHESAHTKMQNTDRTKDLYIQQFLNLCMIYIERLEHFNILVARKIKAGQIQDLYSNIESGKYIREQTERYYEAFDEAILKIYPRFIDELNGLLMPERHVNLAPGQRLTPELRIAAFSRLGIEDSAKVSKFLGLSLNTVYTYRNRLKSRAVSRATFEEDLMKIGIRQEAKKP